MLFLPLLLAATAGTAPDSLRTPGPVAAARLTEPVVTDGRLSEAVWQRPGYEDFVQRDPVEGGRPTERTVLWVAYDNAAIYVAARMYDRGADSLVARLARRDNPISADRFVLYLDPQHDHRTGFYFGINCAGTLYDGVLFNDEWDDASWDGVWEGKAQRDGEGWTMEMRISYSQLRFRKHEHYVWGINALREIARRHELIYLAYQPKSGSGFVSRFANLVNLDGIAPPRRFEALPYLTSRAAFTPHDAGNPFNDGSTMTPEAGLDLKTGVGGSLTLDATLNPDFGQVEVDPAVVNLSDVETFFDEKRPFFVEGSRIFEFGMGGSNNFYGFNWGGPNFFYSRRIGRPPQGDAPDADFVDAPQSTTILGAAKLSGKLGSFSLGGLSALTSRERATMQTGTNRWKEVVEPLTYYGVHRGLKEFGDGQQGLGFISTTTIRRMDDPTVRDELNSSAHAFGVDGWTFLGKSRTWVLTGWAGGSYVRGTPTRMVELQQNPQHYFQRPDAGYLHVDSSTTSLRGWASRVSLNKQKGDWILNTAVGAISPSFDVNDLGSMYRTDIVNGHLVVGRRWSDPGRHTRLVRLDMSYFNSFDFGGNSTWKGIWSHAYAQLLNYWETEWSVVYNPQSFNNSRTRGGPLSINPPGWEYDGWVGSDGRRPVVVALGVNHSDYQRGSERWWRIAPELSWKPAGNVLISVAPTWEHYRTAAQYVDTFDDPLATATFGHRYVFGDLDQHTVSANIRANYIFSPHLSLEVFVQPLVSTGDFRNYRELKRPRTYSFPTYPASDVAIAGGGDSVTVNPDGAGPASSFTFENPDFNTLSLRGNAILRWGYSPGSTVYLVWTQSRSDTEINGNYNLGASRSALFRLKPHNIFAVKVSYYLSR